MNAFFGLKFLLFSFLFFNINCCSPGYYFSSGKCIPCQRGYYSEGAILRSKPSKCEECPEGTYSYKGASKCSPCPAGTYSKSGKCFNCPKGTFSKKGNSLCTPCPEKYFADIEGSSYCKQCPKNTHSDIGSSICFKCTEGDKKCGGSPPKKFKIKRNNSEKDDKSKELEDFGKLMTSIIFGKSIEFENNKATIEIPNFIIIITISNEINFDIIEDLHFLITDHRFGNMKYDNYEIYSSIIEIAEKIIESLKGEYSITIPYLETQIGDHISNGEVTLTYDFLLNSIELTIISKLSDEIGTEYINGVKYKIIPKGSSSQQDPVLEPDENYEENLIENLLGKSKEYVYYIIDFLKSPEVIAVVGVVAAVALTIALVGVLFPGVSIASLIGAAGSALVGLIQNFLIYFRFGLG